MKRIWAGIGLLVLAACTTAAINLQQVNTTSPQTLSNKTYASPIFSGTATGTYTLAGTPTIQNATLSSPLIASPTYSGTSSGVHTYTLSSLAGTATGTYTLAGTPTINNPTLTGGGTLGGSYVGTYTFAGTPTIPTINGATVFTSTLRLPNDTFYLARNVANSADISLVKVNINNQIEFGTPVKNFSLVADPTASLEAATKQYVDTGDGVSAQRQLNPIINGMMDIWQRGTAFAAAANGQFGPDRFYWQTVGAGVVTLNRGASTPTVVQAGVLFNYSMEVDVTTADASIAATDNYSIRHKIEGFNWRHFASRNVLLSFWVKSPKTGIHSVGLRNSGTDRYFIQEYTVSAADTWEYKTILVLASPSGGTWDYANGTGIEVIWTLACGSNFQGTVGTWTTGALTCSANQVNAMDSTANFFMLTGTKLEPGSSTATPIQYVPFEVDLFRAKRYYQKSFSYATAPAQNAGTSTGEYLFSPSVAGAAAGYYTVNLTVPLRAIPSSVTTYNPSAANAHMRNFSDSTDFSGTTADAVSEHQLRILSTGTAGTALGESIGIHWAVAAELP